MEQFVQASLIPGEKPISEVEWELVYEVKRELFSLLV
jgi:hypothetical protein